MSARRFASDRRTAPIARRLGRLVLLAAGLFPWAVFGHEMPSPGSRALGRAASGNEDCCEPDLWLVSTRRLPAICALPTAPALHVERRIAGCWERSDMAALLGDDSRPLLIFIHGNRYEAADAKSQGLLLARRCAATLPEAAAARTVIFSWPSSQQGILLRDSRVKYERAETEGRYLAWLLGQVEPARPVAVVAHSYGALITLEALDNLVRATPAGRPNVTPWIDRPGRVHLVLAASAVRQDALASCGPYRRVTQGIDRLTLLNNSRDTALKFFEFIDPSLRTKALGREHMPARWLPPDVEFVQVDAADIVGRDHRFTPYLSSPSLRKRIATGLLGGLEGE